MEKFVLHITKEMTMAKNRTHNPHIKKKKDYCDFPLFRKPFKKELKESRIWVWHSPTHQRTPIFTPEADLLHL